MKELKHTYNFFLILLYFLVPLYSFSQPNAITSINSSGTEVSYNIFQYKGDSMFLLENPLTLLSSSVTGPRPELTVTGDFNGDGVDELALFYDLYYTPNLNPEFTCSVIMIYKSMGSRWMPVGTWFSELDTIFNFDHVDFSVSGDYNLDGLDDIAIFYNDHNVNDQIIYVLESNGTKFSNPVPYFSADRNEFNFTALKFTVPGNFNGNEYQDIAVFYNYFGEEPATPQAVFLFETTGSSLQLQPSFYSTTRVIFNFNYINRVVSGDFNSDDISDMAILYDGPSALDQNIFVFQGSSTGYSYPLLYSNISEDIIDFTHVRAVLTYNYQSDYLSDLILFYDNPDSVNQEILLLESEDSTFIPPSVLYQTSEDKFSTNQLFSVHSGTFVYKPVVSVATWKDNHKGAISFTFDDGAKGAFELGAAYLDSLNLTGTFYIFTDTAKDYIYDIADWDLVKKYKDKGFEIASHSAGHDDLGMLSEINDTISMEYSLSNAVIELNYRLDQNTISLSIPYGSFRFETLDFIKKYFLTARSSQFGYNLATPFDFYALKTYPVTSKRTIHQIDSLLKDVEQYGYYLPLMYHDIKNKSFNIDSLIYTSHLDSFKRTVDSVLHKDIWIDTHEHVYKYIVERNALETRIISQDENHFGIICDDELDDSLFNVPLTIKISIPENWNEDTVTILWNEKESKHIPLLENGEKIIYYQLIPNENEMIIHNGNYTPIGINNTPIPVKNTAISVFPNPVTYYTTIRIQDEYSENSSIIITTMEGRVVDILKDFNSNEIYYNNSYLVPGVYLFCLEHSGINISRTKVLVIQ